MCVCENAFPQWCDKKCSPKEGKNVYNFYYAQNAVALINFDALMISEKNL